MRCLRTFLCLWLAISATGWTNGGRVHVSHLGTYNFHEDATDISGLNQLNNTGLCDLFDRGICSLSPGTIALGMSSGQNASSPADYSLDVVENLQAIEDFILQEGKVEIPTGTESIVVDIVYNFDMFIDFHQSEDSKDQIHFRLAVENMGDYTPLPKVMFDFQVVSLGPETEILLRITHIEDKCDWSEDLVEVMNTCLVVAFALLVAAATSRQCSSSTSSSSTTKNYKKVTGDKGNQSGSSGDRIDEGEPKLEPLIQDKPECDRTQGLMSDQQDQNCKEADGQKFLNLPMNVTNSEDTDRADDVPHNHTDRLHVEDPGEDSCRRSSLTSCLPAARASCQDKANVKQMTPSTRLGGGQCQGFNNHHTARTKQIGGQTIDLQSQPTAHAKPPCGHMTHTKPQSQSINNQRITHMKPQCGHSIYNNQHITNTDVQHSVTVIGCRLSRDQTAQPIAKRIRLKGLAFVLAGTLVAVAVAMKVSEMRAKPTLHVTFPASTLSRKIRMFSDFTDLYQLSRNHSSLSLLSRLQLLDTLRCKDDLKSCKVSVVCDSSTDQSINCRCPHGFYFRDWHCHACSSTCPNDHYLLSSCSTNTDVVCRPCSVCSRTQYEAAQCNTHRDTICIDVSFPVGILPLNKSHLPDDGLEMSVDYSPNVFMERLIDMEALETPMYVTNNQQSLDFVWPRLSGLDIAVSVTGVFLVPDYRDVEAVDDTALFHKLLEPSQNTKDYYSYVQNHYCRHPVPDYYSLQLEVVANRTSVAEVVRCDSQDDTVPRCPDRFKDGDRYLKWNINAPCVNFMQTRKFPSLKDGPNSVVCTDETDILRTVFRSARPATEEYMFPSRECQLHRRQCEQCLRSAACPEPSATSNETYLEDSQCCAIQCYSQMSCKKTFSPECPPPAVECARGEVNIFSLFPHFETMDRQFSCHLNYVPPVQLYGITYSVRAPSINFNTTPQHFTITPSSRADHERRLSTFDFMSALHDTRMKLQEELILIGDHIELTHYHDSLMKPYTVRELKTPGDLRRQKTFTQNQASKSAFIQFERPFLYSSLTWYRDGCYKNVSQIYPNQTIYKEDFLPVMARRNTIEKEPNKALVRNREYSYQLYHRDRAPFIKFFVERGKSVLQYLQGTTVKGRLVANSLYGRVSWHHGTSTWKLVFSATQEGCPSIITIKIFTQLMTGCAGHFDLLINCPAEFTVTFNFTTGMSDLPDTFIVQVNDSSTSHHMVLSSVYSPIFVREVTSKNSAELGEHQSAEANGGTIMKIWLPVIIIVIVTLILIIVIYIFYKCIHARVRKVDLTLKGSTEEEVVAWNNQGEQVNKTASPSGVKPRPKCFILLFVVLYVIYSLVFTFSLTFGIIYLTHSTLWSNMTNSDHLGRELHAQVNKSLREIQKFEEAERLRLFSSYQERRMACIHHLENENNKLLAEYEHITKRQVDAIFVENGTLHYFTNEIQKENVTVYLQQINDFISECNKTVISIVERFQANYYQFVRNTANNDWLKVPRQIFLHQDGEDPQSKFLSSTQVKQFVSWLEIDKAEELFAAKENVFGRLSSILIPRVSTMDVTFPSLQPHLEFGFPSLDFDSQSHRFSVLEPSFEPANISDISTPTESSGTRLKRDAEMFGLSGNLIDNPFNGDFAEGSEDETASELGNGPSLGGDATFDAKKASRKRDSSKKKDNFHIHDADLTITGKDSASTAIGNHSPLSEALMKNSDEDSGSTIIANHSPLAEALTKHSDSSSDLEAQAKHTKFEILIAVFILLDAFLLLYRMSWLSNQLYAARRGYADRIPTDEACKQVLEIQTAYHLPSFENPNDESSGFYVDNKEGLYGSDRETDITFLQTLPIPKSKDDILQKIWNEKMNQSEDRAVVRMRKCFLLRWYGDLRTALNRLCLSPLVWQGSVTFLAVVFVCVLVYCMEHWLTPANFQALVGGQSAAADVQWHLDTSDRYLHGLARQLTTELRRMKHLCDAEVDVLTDMFFTTVSLQTSMFTTTLQGLCREAKGKNCDKVLVYQSTGGRIVGCNFLPLQAQTFHDLSLSHMEAIVTREVTPLVNLSHRMLAISASVVISLLCCRLLCQGMASTVRHYLLLTGQLPRVRVYQSEQMANAGPVNTTMQRSQSWVDSCESGVYVGEVEETNKEENR